ncbi:hypothetical protein MPTK1_5g05900 [Marchantia polymorpha subsp. ruderalis]
MAKGWLHVAVEIVARGNAAEIAHSSSSSNRPCRSSFPIPEHLSRRAKSSEHLQSAFLPEVRTRGLVRVRGHRAGRAHGEREGSIDVTEPSCPIPPARSLRPGATSSRSWTRSPVCGGRL